MKDFKSAVPKEDYRSGFEQGCRGFAGIYDSYFSRVYNYVRYRVRSPQEADDVTGGIFERVLEKLDTYNPKKSPLPVWIFAIARNTVNDHYRKLRWRSWLSLEDMPEKAGDEMSTDSEMIKTETSARLLEAVGRLSGRERDLIALKFESGMTNRAIAGLTGTSESNVGIIIFRALQRLRSDLRNES